MSRDDLPKCPAVSKEAQQARRPAFVSRVPGVCISNANLFYMPIVEVFIAILADVFSYSSFVSR